MRKVWIFLVSLFLFFNSSRIAHAEAPYTITSFDSKITLQQDTNLLVQETIRVNFTYPRHGIFRTIPVVYSARGRTINTSLNLISVTDENSVSYGHEASRLAQSIEIKIGDPDKTIVGPHTYVITYKIDKVLQRFEEHEEIYWNVTGSEWDAKIENATATVESPYAPIENVTCYAGYLGDKETNCEIRYTDQEARFTSVVDLVSGKDFTVVIGLSKNNSLVFPTKAQIALQIVKDNWGYLPAIAPFLFMVGFWFFRGRDKRYVEGSIYSVPTNPVWQAENVGIFERHYLPMVYSPIKGLTPAELGAIIDEKVDIQDVVSEILELARLGYIKIERTETKRLLGKKTDYILTKLAEDEKGILKGYQRYLLEELFLHGISINKKKGLDRNQTTLSALKNKFYTSLEGFKNRLYKDLKKNGYFYTRPDHTRAVWYGIAIVLSGISIALTFWFSSRTWNFYPYGPAILLIFPTVLFARFMPRKTPNGYNLLQQIKGLHYYVDKGQWRHEIAEKHLFVEEILPIAVALGVVKKLAKDMEELKIRPPEYFAGTTGHGFYHDFNGFYKTGSSSLTSVPASSGRSSWSGGSGFSGGAGGGFGGGGGGSW